MSNTLRDILNSYGIFDSNVELMKKTGEKSSSNVASYLKGTAKPSKNFIKKICDAYNLEIIEISNLLSGVTNSVNENETIATLKAEIVSLKIALSKVMSTVYGKESDVYLRELTAASRVIADGIANVK